MKPLQTIQVSDLHKISDLHEPVAVIGMPGVADIGKFAIDQLIGLFGASKIIDILFYGYPAGVIIDQSLISIPKTEIFFWKDENKQHDLFFITADAQPMNPREIYELSDYIVNMLARFNIKFIVSLGGYPVQNNHVVDPKIFVTATASKYVKKLVDRKICHEISKGVIIGANGLIPSIAAIKHGIDGVVLLSETSNMALVNENMTDLNASMKLIKVLDSLFNFSLNIDFSHKNVENMSKNLEKKRKELENELDAMQTLNTKEEKGKVLYI
jgi:proteasome assembly chaperone (PAC2) family protein